MRARVIYTGIRYVRNDELFDQGHRQQRGNAAGDPGDAGITELADTGSADSCRRRRRRSVHTGFRCRSCGKDLCVMSGNYDGFDAGEPPEEGLSFVLSQEIDAILINDMEYLHTMMGQEA